MAPRARRLQDGHDRVDGKLVGDPYGLIPPSSSLGEWDFARYAAEVVAECMIIVAHVAEAEAANGFDQSAAHYRQVWEHAALVRPYLLRLAVGDETLPLTSLDRIRVDLDRLACAVESLVAFVNRERERAGHG